MRSLRSGATESKLINSPLFLTLILGLAIGLASLKFTYNLEETLPIMTYDETSYLTSGYELHTLPSPDYSPLYSVWYY